MAASTGPAENNTISIQTVELGDTFNLWRDVTNTAVYKINKLKVYDVVDSTSIATTLAAGGTLSLSLSDNVNKGLTFQQPVLFASGVTFNGPVTFNAETVTLNANIVTIDDYNIVLGDTAAASDDKINTAGGGGILLNRGSGATAEWLWQYTQVHGITGVWRANTHIGFSGATSGIYPHNGGSLRVHGSGLQIDGGSTTDHGLLFNLTSTGVAGTTSNRTLEFSRYSPSGSTAFIQVLNGSTYNSGTQPFVNIPSGANRKVVTTATAHGFVFGQPLYLDSSTYKSARANSATTAEVVGLVSRVIDNFNFEITFIGEIFGDFSLVTVDGGSLVSGSVYYLSADISGKITPSVPSAAGQVHKALMIATGSNSAIVYPFTGGVLSSPVTITTSSSLGVNFDQYNQFKVGDFVRWDPSVTSLSYTGTDSKVYSYSSANGAYVKAQANSAAEAEVAGMIISVSDVGGPTPVGVNQSFSLLMDGFFSGLSLDGVYGNAITSGTVYFLAKDCAGAVKALESNTPSFNTSYPTTTGSVRKPLFMATNSSESNFSGYLFSYRGDEVSVQGLSADTKLEDLLVRNLGSCGAEEDLVFGVRDGAGTAGGVRVMRFPKNSKGTVEVGYFGPYAGGKAGASLDVKGVIRGGRSWATEGGDILVSRYPADTTTSTYPETLNVFGSAYSSGNSVLSYGIRPRSGALGYESTSGVGGLGNKFRTALEVGTTGGGSYPGIGVYTTAQTSANQGTAVSVSELFAANTNSMTYSGGNTILTSSGNQGLRVVASSVDQGGWATSALTVSNPKNTISLFLGDGASTTGYGNNEYNGNIRFNGAGTYWGDISYYPNPGTSPYFRFTKNGSTVTTTPNASVGVGSLLVYDSTASTSTLTGALTVAGGVGVGGALYAANINSGTLNASSTTASTSTLTGALTVAGGVGVGGDVQVAGVVVSGTSPTSASHLTRKDYVDSLTRIGSTVYISSTSETNGTPLAGTVPSGWTVQIVSTKLNVTAPSGTTWTGSWIARGQNGVAVPLHVKNANAFNGDIVGGVAKATGYTVGSGTENIVGWVLILTRIA